MHQSILKINYFTTTTNLKDTQIDQVNRTNRIIIKNISNQQVNRQIKDCWIGKKNSICKLQRASYFSDTFIRRISPIIALLFDFKANNHPFLNSLL